MADQNIPQDPPLVTPNADPTLSQLVTSVEKDLLLEITKDIQKQELTEEDAQKLAQEFIGLLPISDRHELLNKLRGLGQQNIEARRVYNKYISSFEEEKRQQTLETMRQHIQTGDLQQAINVAKGAYESSSR